MLGGAWFSAGLLSLLFGGWVYNKFYRSTGNNSKNAAIAAGIAGFLLFLILGSILSFIFARFS